jgi:hypothetical protein
VPNDIEVDADGFVAPPSPADLDSRNVRGLSVCDSVENLKQVGLTGQVRTPGKPLPPGLGIIADGLGTGGNQPKGHHTI